MAFFSLFKTPRHRSFNYKPLYYNEQKEELEERLRAAEKQKRTGEKYDHSDYIHGHESVEGDNVRKYIPGRNIRGKIQKSVYEGRKSAMSPYLTRIIIFVSIIIMMLAVYFLADKLTLFFR